MPDAGRPAMPDDNDRAADQPLFDRMLEMLKAIGDTHSDLERLHRKIRIGRANGRPLVVARAQRKIATCEERLRQLNTDLRARAPTMFSASQCELPLGEIVTRRRPDTGVTVNLHGGQDEGRCRLTIEKQGFAEPVELICGPQDVNLLGFLMAEMLSGRLTAPSVVVSVTGTMARSNVERMTRPGRTS